MIKTRFLFDGEPYLNDVQDIPRAFSPYLWIDENAEDFLSVSYSYLDGDFYVRIFCSFSDNVFSASEEISTENILLYKRYSKRFIKNGLYDYLCSVLNISLPYGSLTGVRPTKLFYELSESQNDIKGYLISEYRTSANRADLVERVVNNQKGIYLKDEKFVDIFINIPFCPTRCAYCSFISSEVWRVKKLLPNYVENVRRELEQAKKFVESNNLMVRAIYVGGGTPTSIEVELLRDILMPCRDFGVEFTVEAGRPDTISEEMLAMLKECGVTRISINPQTFNQATLDLMGRKHTVEQILESYEMAKKYGFLVNMDLIAALKGESFDDFRRTVDTCVSLKPDNITIHTLSIKRGSVYAETELKSDFGLAKRMVEYAYSELFNAGYEPYYMYRQKNMADNLENVGFGLEGSFCVYNIDMMEETISIIGIGAGAMSKKIFGENRLERLSNPKGTNDYLERIESILQNKKEFFCK